MASNDTGSPLDRLLRIFTDVKPGEGFTALLLSLNIFLILMAYYVLKPVREALILGGGSAELKTYMRGELAEQALTNFEIELGLKSPETTPVAATAKDLGPATDKAVEKQTN